ncbi:MAG: BrnA antitoxin family protein [Chloroflexota bacterium]|nr:BrnA antitoxin family protein [Chloroflexota bacterium]
MRYTAAELREMRARGQSQTNWAYIDSLTEAELEASIDWEEEGTPDPDSLRAGIPGPGERINILIDDDIVTWFRAEGAGTGLGFKTRMNDALREYMEARQERPEPVEVGTERRSG